MKIEEHTHVFFIIQRIAFALMVLGFFIIVLLWYKGTIS